MRCRVLVLDTVLALGALDEAAGSLTVSLVGDRQGSALLPAGPLLQLALGFVRFAIGAADRIVEAGVGHNFVPKIGLHSPHPIPSHLRNRSHVEHILPVLRLPRNPRRS